VITTLITTLMKPMERAYGSTGRQSPGRPLARNRRCLSGGTPCEATDHRAQADAQ
jgi:hypothetical protein